MNLPRIYLIAIVLLANGVRANGQETPKAVLVDEFGKLPCEDAIARQDNLFAELEKAPNSIGYAIIFADSNHLKEGRQTETMFNGQTEFRRFDDSRFKVIRAVGSSGLKVQLWLVPPGAEIPKHSTTEWDFELDPTSKPVKVNASDYDEGPCPIGSQFKLYSDRLKANPHARGHIVIWARTRALFQREKERIDRDLIAKHKIDASRIRYFHLPHGPTYVKWEYWIVPGRNN